MSKILFFKKIFRVNFFDPAEGVRRGVLLGFYSDLMKNVRTGAADPLCRVKLSAQFFTLRLHPPPTGDVPANNLSKVP